ncbi:MAG: MFS transporter [Kineosporiaceae bacterium]
MSRRPPVPAGASRVARARARLVHLRLALLCGVVLGVVFGTIEGYSIFYIAFVPDIGATHGQASAMFAASLWVSNLLAPALGDRIDGWGARRVMIGAGAAYALGLAAASPASSLWWLAVVYLGVLGPASCALVLGCQVYLNAAYTADRGTAVGVAYSFIGLGNFVIFPLLGAVVSGASWRTAYLVAGAIAAALVLVLWVAAPRALSADSSRPAEPVVEASVGQGDTPARAPRHRAGPPTDAPTDAEPDPPPVRWSSLLVPRTGLLLLAGIAAGAIDFALFQHLVPSLVNRGMDVSAAANVLAVTSLGYFGGQLAGGWASDRAGREVVAVGAAALAATGYVLLVLSPGSSPGSPGWAVLAAGPLGGAAIGALIGSRTATTGDLFQGPALARVSGTVQTATAVGAAAATWFGGFSLDHFGGQKPLFAATAVACLVFALAIVAAAPRRGVVALRGVAPAVPAEQVRVPRHRL